MNSLTEMKTDKTINWLMHGDVAIQYQVSRDLLHVSQKITSGLQRKIETEGWGARFPAKQKNDGHWWLILKD
jgi:hypothetical protein